MPNTSKADADKNYNYMDSIRQVIQYSGLTYNQVLLLPTDTFLLMRKNYVIEKLSETEDGRKYLQDCKRLNTVQPDLKALRKKF